MSGKQIPGPLCGHSQKHWLDEVNDGTMCLQSSPTPGPLSDMPRSRTRKVGSPPVKLVVGRPWQCGLTCTLWNPASLGAEEPIEEVPQVQAGRSLTAGEIKLARSVFGNAINYTSVRIYRGYYLSVKIMGEIHGIPDEFNTMTPDGSMYFHPQAKHYRDDFSAVGDGKDGQYLKHHFIHEMTHVWQHQSGRYVATLGALLQAKHQPAYWIKEKLGIEIYNAYTYTLNAQGKLSDYNIEQQGDVVADSFSLAAFGWVSDSCQNKTKPGIADFKKVVPFNPGVPVDVSPEQLKKAAGKV